MSQPAALLQMRESGMTLAAIMQSTGLSRTCVSRRVREQARRQHQERMSAMVIPDNQRYLADTMLSTRVKRALDGIGIYTVAGLKALPLATLEDTGNLGKKSLREIKVFLGLPVETRDASNIVFSKAQRAARTLRWREEVVKLHDQGYTQAQISETMGISRVRVGQIRRAHIKATAERERRAAQAHLPENQQRIADTTLSNRIKNALGYTGILTIADLKALSASDLTGIPNLGQTSLRELTTFLKGQN